MRKRCWKTVLSAILASAMLFTSVPSNLTMTVHAEELGMEDTLVDVNETEDEDEQENENLTGNEAGEEENVQNPVGGGINVVDPADDGDGNDVTDDSDGVSDSNREKDSDINADEPSGGNGNSRTIAEGAVAKAEVNGNKVTFTCKPDDNFFAYYDEDQKKPVAVALNQITDVSVQGKATPTDNSWSMKLPLSEKDGVWTGTWTAPQNGTYEYQFKANDYKYYMLDGNQEFEVTDSGVEETYAGPTIDYNPNSEDPGAVTFYYPLTYTKDNVEKTIEYMHVRGGWVDDWSDHIAMSKGQNDVLWSVTIPTSKLTKDSSIQYGFGINESEDVTPDGDWSKDPANPNNKGNCVIHRNPDIDNDGNVTLYYYPSHGKYPETVKVKYRKGNTGEYTEVEMTRDSVDTAVYSVKLTGLEEAEYEYHFDVDEKPVVDTNNAETGKIILVNYPKENPDVKSPVIDGSKATFNYYGPGQKRVQLAGTMTNWGADPVDMEYNEDTAYWSITRDLGGGFHQYKFISSKEGWIADPLHSGEGELFGENSYFVIAGLENAKVSVGVGVSTELPATLPLWNGDEKTDKPASDASKAVTYTLSAETNKADYKDKIALETATKDGVTITTVNVTKDFPASVNDFTLTASDGNNHTSTVTVTVIREVSPDIVGKTVKFVYDDSKVEGNVTAVYVAGSMNGWQNTVNFDDYKMAKNKTGKWELTKEMSAGSYEYKYIYFIGDSTKLNWTADPLNPNNTGGDDPNSKFVVEGLVDSEVEVPRGDEKIELPAELQLYGADGKSTPTAVTYAFSEETNAKDYKKDINLTTEQGKTYISLKETFPDDVDKFTLTASDNDKKNTSTVTVTIVGQLYKYTIYYYDEDHCTSEDPTKDAGLWVYSKGVNGTLKEFTETEEIDGNTWLKAEMKLSLTDLYIIPRNGAPANSWVWQDETRHYNNKAQAEETTLYIVFGDLKKIYTEVPRTVKIPKRYLVVEYERSDSIADWNFYTWNSGFGGNVYVPFEDEDGDGVGTAVIPVKQGLESISFCLERAEGEAHWAEKDGDDYTCRMPLDQNVVKVKMKEGQGITYTYPYNTGYEIKGSEGEIDFFYRDDQAFLAGSEGGYDVVNLDIIVPAADGQEASKQSVRMIYDEDEQRYECALDQLIVGDYYYRYGRQETAESEVEYVLDDFNDKIKTVEETKYSVLEYAVSEYDVEVSMQNTTMDYNDNNVLTIKVKAKDKDGKEIEDASALNLVGRATVDLSAVGGGVTEIDPELLQIAIAVKQGTPAGEKTLPITVYDQCNNEKKTEVKVTVVDRNKGSDFDWDEAVIYFAVTDRFFDGNSGNNDGGVSGSYDKTTNNGDNSSYHGGDFAGLNQKLDYLKGLGVNTIWITPIVEQQETANTVDNTAVTKAWGYHGYWAKDFEKLDKHLGTEEEFSALLNAAHARGMKIMVDVVLNHSGYGVEDKFNSILKDADGNFIPMIRTDDDVVGGSDQKSSLAGLPDFLTENKEVRDLLVEWQSKWIKDYPIDYYRVDTVKHVDDTTWSAFKNALTLNNPDFKMIGEWAGAGYATDTGALNTGRMDSLLDFDFNNKASDFVMGRISETESFMVSRNSAINNTATLGAFLGSHDEDGFIYKLSEGGEYNYCTKEEASALALVAASLQMTAKGQVVIYYGEEIGMTGADNYPYQTNRYDFDWDTAESGNATLTHYKKMLAIRNKYSDVLAKGSRATVTADNERGLDVFTRSYGGTSLIVALNIRDTAQEYVLAGQNPGATFYDNYSDTQYVADKNGNVVITVPAAADGGTVVLEAGQGAQGEINVPATMQVRSIPDQTYTGLSIKLSEDVLQVYHGTTKLTAGVDYSVSYKNNKAVGTATVTIKGKGNYKDSATVQFNIVPKDIATDGVEIIYNEFVKANTKEQKPLSKITYNGKKLTTKEYKVEYYKLENGQKTGNALKGVKELGDYQMVITGLKNYTGTVSKTIHVVDQGTFMNTMRITLKYNNAPLTSTTYTGDPIEPEVTVVDGQKTLKGSKTEDDPTAEYIYTYSNNVDVGTASVKITGVSANKYYGSVTKTFKITGKSLSSDAKIDTAAAKWQNKVVIDPKSGKAEQANASLTKKNNSSPDLIKGKDYEVIYSNNTKPGTATVTFEGMGLYKGSSLKKTFKVTALAWTKDDLNNDLLVNVSKTAPFSKKGAQPAVTVTYKNKKLTAGKDYKVTYNNNKDVTTNSTAANKKPSVNITGMGMFSGTIKNAAEFTIVKANLDTAGITVTVRDAVYSDQKESLKSKPVVKEANGTILVEGANKDYTVTYQAKNGNGQWVDLDDTGAVLSAGGSMKVEVTAVTSGNYAGSTTKEYKIVKASILNATIIAKAQTYTGKEITLDANDFSKARIGKKTLTYDKDFEIVPGSYEKNVNKGNATVTIRGIGDYGDEKKVTFRITSSGMRWWWNLFS